MNSILSWMGGKKALRDLIYERFPKEYERYIEVFGGAAWVLFGMEKICGFEVYNDFNANLYNLFRCVKERVLAFLLELGFLPLTSRDEFKMLKRQIKKKKFNNPFLAEELNIARKHLSEPDAEEIAAILTERSKDADIRRAVAFFKLMPSSPS